MGFRSRLSRFRELSRRQAEAEAAGAHREQARGASLAEGRPWTEEHRMAGRLGRGCAGKTCERRASLPSCPSPRSILHTPRRRRLLARGPSASSGPGGAAAPMHRTNSFKMHQPDHPDPEHAAKARSPTWPGRFPRVSVRSVGAAKINGGDEHGSSFSSVFPLPKQVFGGPSLHPTCATRHLRDSSPLCKAPFWSCQRRKARPPLSHMHRLRL